MTDFFVSYTGIDKRWAEWIAFVLEEEGFSVIIQAWDFRPGANFVLEMQAAAAKAERTVMVLSPEYLESLYAAPEWAAAFGRDPTGIGRKLVPGMVRPCTPTGLLAPIVHLSLVDLDEAAARAELLDGVRSGRAKRRFLKDGFEIVRQRFEANARQAGEDEPRLQIDVEMQTASDLRAECFLDGRSKSRCRVWIGGMLSENSILYAQGQHFGDNSYNDMLTIGDGDGLHFSALGNMGYSQFEQEIDVKRMTAHQMADYLWDRFASSIR